MEDVEVTNSDSYIKKIKFKGSDDLYQIELLPASKCRVVFSNFISLALPLFTAAYEKYDDYTKQLTILSQEGDETLSPDVGFFDLSVIFGQLVTKPEFEAFVEGLIIGFKKNNEDALLEEEFRGEFDNYLKLVEYAFRENLLTPLKSYLEAKKLTSILTCLQGATEAVQGVMKK